MTSRWRRLLGWALGLALLVYLLQGLPLPALAQAWTQISWTTWLLAWLGLLLSYALRVWRMQLVMVPAAPHDWLPTHSAVWRVMLLHNAAINLLPMRSGELSFPWWAKRELGLPVARSVAALVWMRVQDLAVLALLAVLAWPALPLAAGSALVALWLIGLLCLRPIARKLLQPLLPAHDSVRGAAGTPPASKLAQFAAALHSALHEPAHHRPLTWLCSAGNWLVKLAASATLIAAAAPTTWALGWTGALGGELASLLPVQGPAGIGTYEAGVLAGIAWLGDLGSAAPRQAVWGALCWHGIGLLSALLGASLAWFWPRRPATREATPARGPDSF